MIWHLYVQIIQQPVGWSKSVDLQWTIALWCLFNVDLHSRASSFLSLSLKPHVRELNKREPIIAETTNCSMWLLEGLTCSHKAPMRPSASLPSFLVTTAVPTCFTQKPRVRLVTKKCLLDYYKGKNAIQWTNKSKSLALIKTQHVNLPICPSINIINKSRISPAII
jgi:hypothetical protein